MTADGIALIKRFEGCRLTAYQDDSPERIWTIGWGCTHGVTPGMAIDQATADAWLVRDLGYTEALLEGCLGGAPVPDSAWNALVSFCYNVGFGLKGIKSGFRVLVGGNPSTLLKKVLAGNFEGAAEEFPKWAHSGGSLSAGLLTRRLAEKAMFEGEPDGQTEKPA